jgi:hypothetical protein
MSVPAGDAKAAERWVEKTRLEELQGAERLPDHERETIEARCATDERVEVPPPHSITSSARAITVAGISRPIAFAVFKLMTNSNVTGCAMGRSSGLVPRKILSV